MTTLSMRAEEKAEVSRRNGRLSRGPKTEEGEQRSSQAARDHGPRATTIPREPGPLVTRGVLRGDSPFRGQPGARDAHRGRDGLCGQRVQPRGAPGMPAETRETPIAVESTAD